MNRQVLFFLLAFGVLALAGCQEGVVGDVTANQPPDTRVTSGPPALELTSFTVEFFWTGSDTDGTVEYFEWRISDNGPDGIVSVEDTLGLPWHQTVATDSIFVVSADIDSFQNDIDNPTVTDPKDYRFWQTHTFFVRSVDDNGAPDPTPDEVSFTATTLAPNVTITLPAATNSNSCVTSARALTFGWEGNDPDEITGIPAAARYALVNVVDVPVDPPLPKGACLTTVEYNDLNPVSYFTDQDWSEWIPYDAAEDSGRVATFSVKDIGQSFFFAVQLKDVAGAVTPSFRWGKNLRHVKIAPGKFPSLAVTEKFLGIKTFTGQGGIKAFEIVAGQPLEFSWQANASSYAGIIEAYRFGWEIQDVNDSEDPGWAVPWGKGQSYLRAPTRSFQQGSPNFVVQCRDNSGTITRASYQLDVIQITPRAQQYDLLVIDDFGLGDTSQEEAVRQDWRAKWEFMLSRVLNFDPAADYYVAADSKQDIDFRLVNQYKSVIWFLMGNNATTVYNEKLRPSQGGEVRYNWLEVYQSRVGNLLFVGPYTSLGMVEPIALDLPLIYNTEDRPPDGLGCETQPDGSCIPKGTLRWPYTGWNLDASDCVRPPRPRYDEEPGADPTTTLKCDYLFRAEVSTEFLTAYPSADGTVEDLTTTASTERIPGSSGFPQDLAFYKYAWEEFYNRNIVESKNVTINTRSAHVPMFLHRAARDEVWPAGTPMVGQPLVANADSSCYPLGSEFSPLNGAPNGVASSVYSEFKQLPGSQDFLWGFHPLAFELSRVEAALLWIIGQNWDIEVSN